MNYLITYVGWAPLEMMCRTKIASLHRQDVTATTTQAMWDAFLPALRLSRAARERIGPAVRAAAESADAAALDSSDTAARVPLWSTLPAISNFTPPLLLLKVCDCSYGEEAACERRAPADTPAGGVDAYTRDDSPLKLVDVEQIRIDCAQCCGPIR